MRKLAGAEFTFHGADILHQGKAMETDSISKRIAQLLA